MRIIWYISWKCLFSTRYGVFCQKSRSFERRKNYKITWRRSVFFVEKTLSPFKIAPSPEWEGTKVAAGSRWSCSKFFSVHWFFEGGERLQISVTRGLIIALWERKQFIFLSFPTSIPLKSTLTCSVFSTSHFNWMNMTDDLIAEKILGNIWLAST